MTIRPPQYESGGSVSFSQPVVGTAALCWFIALTAWAWQPAFPIDPQWLTRLTPAGLANFHPDYDLHIYLIACCLSVLATTLVAIRYLRSSSPPPGCTQAHVGHCWRILDVAVPLLIAAIVWVPDSSALAAQAFK